MTQSKNPQTPAFDEEVTVSLTKSVSPVKIGNGSPGAHSASSANTDRAEQVHFGSHQDSLGQMAGTDVTNSSQSSEEQKEPTDNPIPASPKADTDATPTASAEPLPSDSVVHASQDSPEVEDGVGNQPQSGVGDIVQGLQASSAESQPAEARELEVSPPSSPVKQAIPFSSQAYTESPEAVAPADAERATSLQLTAALSTSGRDAMQPQASLPVDSQARAAAVAEAIKRASRASEPEKAATQGMVQPSNCFKSCKCKYVFLLHVYPACPSVAVLPQDMCKSRECSRAWLGPPMCCCIRQSSTSVDLVNRKGFH